jgi:carbon dioxide concentrating mechanism protein CcmM
VRLFGIDNGRKRVLETIIQRPDGVVATSTSSFKTPAASYSSYNGNGNGNGAVASGSLSAETVNQIRQLLANGYKIGTEHVDQRRFRTGSWQSCNPIEATSANDVVAALEECMTSHQGEYVRLIGIDSKAKRRVLEAIIQRPNGQVVSSSSAKTSATLYSGATASATATSTRLSAEVVDQLKQLLTGGFKISVEHVDQRRFRTGSWASCGQIQATSERDALAALEAVISEYAGEYVRLIGIDPVAKRRVLEAIIQRP